MRDVRQFWKPSAGPEAFPGLRGRRRPPNVAEEPLLRYYRLLGSVELEVASPVTPEEEAKWSGLVAPKDAHVLAGAAKAKADVLISLDRRHILTERVRKGFPIPVQDTGEFLRGIAEEAETQQGDRGEPGSK